MAELDYELPGERVAVRPAEPRDHSRLMVVDRGSGKVVRHGRFFELVEFLRKGDVVVTNETRVLPAKIALRRESGAAIPGLFVREVEVGRWEVMLRTRGKAKEGERLVAPGTEFGFVLEKREGEGLWEVRVSPPTGAAMVLARIGAMPVPPYIEKERRAHGEEFSKEDLGWYQTVFARGEGKSVAAPTAGLHFTEELLRKMEGMGVERVGVELEVGLGTFLPVETETLEEHRMHVERYRVPGGTVAALRKARAEGRRIVVVGTTAVRTLEAAAERILGDGPPTEIEGETDLKIAPGYRFRLTEALVTNFHLPRSTLMALVGAFLGESGVGTLKGLYGEAIGEGYRFYSYGDAMFIADCPLPIAD